MSYDLMMRNENNCRCQAILDIPHLSSTWVILLVANDRIGVVGEKRGEKRDGKGLGKKGVETREGDILIKVKIYDSTGKICDTVFHGRTDCYI